MDDLQYTARCWRASGRILAASARLEEKFGLDPRLLDELDEKTSVFVRDPQDVAARADFAVALAGFLAATLEEVID